MAQWSDVPLSSDAQSFLFDYDFSATFVCTACNRPLIPEENSTHVCPLDVQDSDSMIWTKNSVSSVGKSSSKRGAGSTRKPVRKTQLDLDRHCGVIIAPSGNPCMRSLTCKSHSSSSKRSVIGRSGDFDTLLAEYIRKNPSKVTSSSKSAASDSAATTIANTQLSQSASSTNLSSRLQQFQCTPFVGNINRCATASRSHWLSKNVGMWISEPLRIYSQTRKAQHENAQLSK